MGAELYGKRRLPSMRILSKVFLDKALFPALKPIYHIMSSRFVYAIPFSQLVR